MTDTSVFLEECLARLKTGDMTARDELIAGTSGRLSALARRMLRDNPRVARWEQADDLIQQATLRIHRSLAEFVPLTVEEFFRFAALNMRRELTDMARHHFGPEGVGAHHANPGPRSAPMNQSYDPYDSSSNPHKLALWTEFHAAVEKLPEIEKQVFDLLWYHELKQSDAAVLLKVTERQLRRYWQSARLKLQDLMGDAEHLW